MTYVIISSMIASSEHVTYSIGFLYFVVVEIYTLKYIIIDKIFLLHSGKIYLI
jgi:hypothetical protein